MRDLSMTSPSIEKSASHEKTVAREPGRQTLAERLQSLVDDRRGNQKAIPIDLARYLNQLQLVALHSLENFGWHLWFVRRPLFMQPIVVVTNKDASELAVLEEDGSVNMRPSLQLRN
jgi:hypothetical protein